MAIRKKSKQHSGVVVDSHGEYGLRCMAQKLQALTTEIRGEKAGMVAGWSRFVIKQLPPYFMQEQLDGLGKTLGWLFTRRALGSGQGGVPGG